MVSIHYLLTDTDEDGRKLTSVVLLIVDDSWRNVGTQVHQGALNFQPLAKDMTTPAAAPTKSRRHAVDCTKKPGSRLSTALL